LRGAFVEIIRSNGDHCAAPAALQSRCDVRQIVPDLYRLRSGENERRGLRVATMTGYMVGSEPHGHAAPVPLSELTADVRRGVRRAIGRAMSEVENQTAVGIELARLLRADAGRAHVVGVTGPPGAGKSTLVSSLIGALRERGRSVGVVAIDPSSPESGGAVLGDRVRMDRHVRDNGVFVRSLASRGDLGGLSRAALRVIDVLDAARFDTIIVETVGAGQTDLEIADIADTRIVVCPPGLGDDVQAIKAGVLEIADILVVTKADLPHAGATERDLRYMVGLRPHNKARPAVLCVVATRGDGIGPLVEALQAHAVARERKTNRYARAHVRHMLAHAAAIAIRDRLCSSNDATLERLCDAFAAGEIDETTAVTQALNWFASAASSG